MEGGRSLLPAPPASSKPPGRDQAVLSRDGSQLPAFPKRRRWHLGLLDTNLPFAKGM